MLRVGVVQCNQRPKKLALLGRFVSRGRNASRFGFLGCSPTSLAKRAQPDRRTGFRLYPEALSELISGPLRWPQSRPLYQRTEVSFWVAAGIAHPPARYLLNHIGFAGIIGMVNDGIFAHNDPLLRVRTFNHLVGLFAVEWA